MFSPPIPTIAGKVLVDFRSLRQTGPNRPGGGVAWAGAPPRRFDFTFQLGLEQGRQQVSL